MNRLYFNDELQHHGILGQKWGVRRYQNYDGTYTKAGMARYNKAVESGNRKDIREAKQNLKDSYAYDKGKELSESKGKFVGKQVGNAAASAAAVAGAYGLFDRAANSLDKSNVVYNYLQKQADAADTKKPENPFWDRADKLGDKLTAWREGTATPPKDPQERYLYEQEYRNALKRAMAYDDSHAEMRAKKYALKDEDKGAAILAGVLAAGAGAALVIGIKKSADYKKGEEFVKAYKEGPTYEMEATLNEYKKDQSDHMSSTKDRLSNATKR